MNIVGNNYLKLLENCLNPIDLNIEERFKSLQKEVLKFSDISAEVEETLSELSNLATKMGVAEILTVEGDDVYKLIESHNCATELILTELGKEKPNINIFNEINSNRKEIIKFENSNVLKKIKTISENYDVSLRDIPLKIIEYKKNLQYCEIDYSGSNAKILSDFIASQNYSLKNIIDGAPFDFFDELFGIDAAKKINSLVISCEKEFAQTYSERVKQLAEIERLQKIELKRLEAERERIELEKKKVEEARLKKEREEQARLKAERERFELEKKTAEEARLKKEREEQARLQAEQDAKELAKKKIEDEQLRQEKAAKEEIQKRELAERLRIEQEVLLRLQAEREKLKIVEDRLQKEKEELLKIQADREAKELQQKREKEKQERQLKEEELKKYREEAARIKAEQEALEVAQREEKEELLRIEKEEKAKLDEELRKKQTRNKWFINLSVFLAVFLICYFVLGLDSSDSAKDNSAKTNKYFTAAYYDKYRNAWGLSVKTTNQTESNNEALKKCISDSGNASNTSCEKVIIPNYRCLAVAYSKNYLSTALGAGDNITIAGNFAVSECNKGLAVANCSVSKVSVCAP